MIDVRKNAAIIFEHINLTEADYEDVEVVGFDIQDELEPQIWDQDGHMNQEVRERLLQIADEFIGSLLFEIKIDDIRLTGSLASYNWSQFSDVDLHIVVDFNSIDDDEDLVRAYFNAKKTIWNIRHEIYIYDYEVEIYVENLGDTHIALGKYSVDSDVWIKEPSPDIDADIETEDVKKKASSIMSQIEYVEYISKDNPAEAEKLAEKVKEKIRKMRASGLVSSKGVYSVKNIAFKVLRRNGYLERLSSVKTQSYDRAMSLANV
jgi:predicted nucleotidyltransferase